MPRTQGMFAGYPAPWVYAEPDGKTKVQQLLWGDWVGATDERRNGYRFLKRARNSSGWVREVDLQPDRLLEVNFVDVGQGDGCFVVTPDDRWILIDAGEGPEMFGYLSWRFNLARRSSYEKPLCIDHAILTHPDKDHYGGLDHILDSPHFTIDTLHHNGIIERANGGTRGRLGPRSDDGRYLTDIIIDRAALETLLVDADVVGRYPFPRLMRKVLDSGRVNDVFMLSVLNRHLPGFATGDLTIDVLGPVAEREATTDRVVLRRLGDDGKTKNGHSVVLRVRYGDVTLSLGGDLNIPAQRLLVEHHTAVQSQQLDREDVGAFDRALADVRKAFQADVAKACHHGSSDIDDFFLEATNAIATVISSGDNESHAHPRPDALGAIGKFGRGSRPLIFSTELARSYGTLKRPEHYRREHWAALEHARRAINAGQEPSNEEAKRVTEKYERSIAVFGMITLRTDGRRVQLAQKLEKKRQAAEFQIYCLEPHAEGLVWNPRPQPSS